MAEIVLFKAIRDLKKQGMVEIIMNVVENRYEP
jgi:hypothetical protein